MGKYESLAQQIVKNIGGKENVNSVVHCITRLRFSLKDEAQADTVALENMDGVVAVMKAGGQYQVVIGNHVSQVFDEVVASTGQNPSEGGEVEKMSVFNRVIDIISGSFQPFLGALAAGGMIKGLLALLVAFNVLTATDGTYLLLNAVGDAIFTFLPIIVGITAARKFKLNEFVGLVLGAILMYPAIQLSAFGETQPIGTLFSGTIIESQYFTTFLGLPVIAQNYSGTVVPIIFTVWLASIIQKQAKKMIPELLQTFFVPFFTLLVAAPLALLVVGPTLNIATDLLSTGFQNLLGFNPIIFMALIGLLWQVLVIFGLHWALVSVAIVQVGADGFTQMLAGTFGASFAQVAVVLALWLKFRKQDKGLRTLGIPAMISGLAGVTEPAIYGLTLKRKRAFLYSMIGGAAGGAILGMANSGFYTMGGLGVFGLPAFVSPTGNMVLLYNALLGLAVSMLVSFGLTYLFYKEPAEVTSDDKVKAPKPTPFSTTFATNTIGSESFHSPLTGEVRALHEASDEVFSSGAMGQGVIVLPKEGKVVAPFDGEVITIFPTGHAIGLRSDRGAELLVHIGMNTVELQGQHYEKFVKTGDRFSKGDLLIKFDKEAIEAAGYVTETPVILTNTPDYSEIKVYTDNNEKIIETAS
ncbi:beta-glucoside-specific PTS transporter subunit IIABC [Lactococcus allomyrinae]|uniref:PTS system sucrose-specific EIIBCA component n=1 Tax=Lactococcus allomyrinae TaxID=2419773 RepID=A0A387BDW9_9LACT|nr:beta-glucoside-specific PTS transporter subunit IIABC [Lactococcus allomyrinae]AYG00718.1 PTS beta-glucoside transporter subunit IIABC [Lactococcus allomyrinae]